MTRRRMTRPAFLGGLTYALILAGLSAVDGRILALALPLVIYLAASIIYRPRAVELAATRQLSSYRATQGDTVQVSVHITNKGPSLEEVHLHDPVPAALEVTRGRSELATALPPGATATLDYTLRVRRGAYGFASVQATATDHLGLSRAHMSVAAPAQLLVLPPVQRLPRIDIRPRRTRVYSGHIPARRGGPGVTFFGVREAEPGDPLRRVNWRISARHPQALFSNEFEQERVADVGVILDVRQRSDVRTSSHALLDHGVEAAAALSEAFLRDGNRVGLLLYGGYLDWTVPAYGKVQRERILHALARAAPGTSMAFERLDHLPTRLFPSGSQLVLISPVLTGDPPTLMRLRARGYHVLVVSPDPVAFEAHLKPGQPAVGLAARVAAIERALVLQQLRRANIRVVEWDVAIPLEQAVRAGLRRSVWQWASTP